MRGLAAEGEAEQARVLAAKGEAQAKVVDAGPSTEERRRLAGLTARSAAWAEKKMHLRIDLAAGMGWLYDGPYPLRRFVVWAGPHDPLGLPGALEPGSHTVTGVWGAHPPPALRSADDASAAPWPGEVPERPWDVLQVDTTLVYSATPPLPAITGEAMPNTVRVGEMDLAAVLPSLPVGAPVHVW